MPQNKSVEETITYAKKIGMVKKQGQATQYCFTETQLNNIFPTSQEREREIVEAILEALNGMTIASSPEFKAGYDLAIVDAIERVRFVTNPNKD